MASQLDAVPARILSDDQEGGHRPGSPEGGVFQVYGDVLLLPEHLYPLPHAGKSLNVFVRDIGKYRVFQKNLFLHMPLQNFGQPLYQRFLRGVPRAHPVAPVVEHAQIVGDIFRPFPADAVKGKYLIGVLSAFQKKLCFVILSEIRRPLLRIGSLHAPHCEILFHHGVVQRPKLSGIQQPLVREVLKAFGLPAAPGQEQEEVVLQTFHEFRVGAGSGIGSGYPFSVCPDIGPFDHQPE